MKNTYRKIVAGRGFTVEEVTESRYDLAFDDVTPNGEALLVSLILCEDPGGKSSLPGVWHKLGRTPRRLATWWSVDVYATAPDGTCRGRYNPTEKLEYFSEVVKSPASGRPTRHTWGRPVLDFDWVLEATPENAEKLLREIIARAYGD